MSHTHGPWSFYEDYCGGARRILGGPRNRAIAELVDVDVGDAHLMAAAPELLDCLAECVGVLELYCPAYSEQLVADSREAIKKAKGES